jgi:hypothetical protein
LRRLDHAPRQRRLGGKLDSFRHCGGAETLAIGGPLYRLKMTYLLSRCTQTAD